VAWSCPGAGGGLGRSAWLAGAGDVLTGTGGGALAVQAILRQALSAKNAQKMDCFLGFILLLTCCSLSNHLFRCGFVAALQLSANARNHLLLFFADFAPETQNAARRLGDPDAG